MKQTNNEIVFKFFFIHFISKQTKNKIFFIKRNYTKIKYFIGIMNTDCTLKYINLSKK